MRTASKPNLETQTRLQEEAADGSRYGNHCVSPIELRVYTLK